MKLTLILALLWVLPPIFNTFFHAIIGRLSDRCTCEKPLGRRIPFIIVLSFVAVIGLVGFMSAEIIFTDYESEIGAVVMLFASFLVVDVAVDLILVPGRSVASDVVPEEQLDITNNIFVSFGSVGRFSALVYGESLSYFYADDPIWFYRAMFLGQIGALLGSCAIASIVLYFVNRKTVYDNLNPTASLIRKAKASKKKRKKRKKPAKSICSLFKSLPFFFYVLYLMQVVVWLGLQTQNLYFTTLTDGKTVFGTNFDAGIFGMLAGCALGLFFIPFMNFFNSITGKGPTGLWRTFAFSCLWTYMCLMLAPLTENIYYQMILVIITGPAQMFMGSNAYTISELIFDGENRATIIGLLNTPLTIAQIISSAVAGFIIEATSVEYLFFFVGITCWTLSVMLLVLDCVCGRSTKTRAGYQSLN